MQGLDRFLLGVLIEQQAGLGEFGRPVETVELLVRPAQKCHHRLVVTAGLTLEASAHHQSSDTFGQLGRVVRGLAQQALHRCVNGRFGGLVIAQ